MTALFAGLTTDNLEQATDVVGGFQQRETDIYTGLVKLAYVGKAESGASNISLIIDIDGQEHRETIYFTNKAGENFYLDKKDPKKKHPLPGFTTINDLCLVASGKPLAQQDAQEKVVKLYDFTERKEVPKAVTVLVDLLNQPVALALGQVLQNKQVKDASGVYVPTADTFTTVQIEKVLHPGQSNKTVLEISSGSDAKYADAWLAQHKGKVRDKRTIKTGDSSATVASGRPTPPQATTIAPPTTSLFGKKPAA